MKHQVSCLFRLTVQYSWNVWSPVSLCLCVSLCFFLFVCLSVCESVCVCVCRQVPEVMEAVHSLEASCGQQAEGAV